MTSNNKNPFQTTAKTSSSSLYVGFTILLCQYGFLHLPTLPQKILSKLFFGKKYGSSIPYLPTVWTYVKSFVVFFYLGFTILICQYGFPHLPTLPQKILSKFFFRKKYGSKIPYLPMVWTYVQSFVVFFIWDSLLSHLLSSKV